MLTVVGISSFVGFYSIKERGNLCLYQIPCTSSLYKWGQYISMSYVDPSISHPPKQVHKRTRFWRLRQPIISSVCLIIDISVWLDCILMYEMATFNQYFCVCFTFVHICSFFFYLWFWIVGISLNKGMCVCCPFIIIYICMTEKCAGCYVTMKTKMKGKWYKLCKKGCH